MAPIVHGLEAEYADKIAFSYLDIDDPATDPFKQQLGYSGQPQYFLVDGTGQIVESWAGRVSREEFVTAFDAVAGQ